MKTHLRTLIASVGLLATTALAQSNIDATNKYAWGENIGWTNWRDANSTNDGVIVGTDFLEGFIWGENVGWINTGDGAGPYANTNGTNFGVNIDADDDLSGYAWGENIGWINFGWGAAGNLTNRARFDFGAGRFRGYAWGENIGWINLDDSVHFVSTSVGCSCVTATDCGNTACSDDNACNQGVCATGVCQFTCTRFGDVKAPPDGLVNLDDILCVLSGFANFPNCPNSDIHPCGGNGIINIDDILSVLAAFSGQNLCGCTENSAPGTGVPPLCGSSQP